MKFERILLVPGVPERMRVWCAESKDHAWCITYEPGNEKWRPEEKAQWVGYIATYSKLPDGEIVRVPGGPWQAFPFAVEACNIKLRELQYAAKKVEVQGSVQSECES